MRNRLFLPGVICAVLAALPICGQSKEQVPAQKPAPVQPGVYWLRTYPMREYGQLWHLDLQVKNGAKARKQILDLIKKYGGAPTQDIDRFPATKDYKYQQFSFRLQGKEAQQALRRLERLGKVRNLSQKENLMPEVSEEIPNKLRGLNEEKIAERDALAKMPAISAAVDELLSNLESAYISYKDSSDRVLLNVAVQEADR